MEGVRERGREVREVLHALEFLNNKLYKGVEITSLSAISVVLQVAALQLNNVGKLA